MTHLPPPLASWSALLDLFEEPEAAHLGTLLLTLQAALGPLGAPQARGDGDFDGYDGLASRGPYERLLPTEWLLAAEAPDEFVRRAAMHEHAFLRPGLLSRRATRPLCTALFDAGPDQLGRPRIAHVALLVVLARRAEEAGGRFEWAVAGGTPRIHDRVDRESVGAMLNGRTLGTPPERCRWPWADAETAGERWMVGGAGLLPHDGCDRIVIGEEDDGAAPPARLRVRIERAGRRAREVVLELPSVETCVRLLRDPFRPARAVRQRWVESEHLPQSAMIFVQGGRLVCARGEGNEVLLLDPRGPTGAGPRAAAFPQRPLAAGGEKRVTAIVCRDGNDLFLHVRGRDVPASPCPLPDEVEMPPEEAFLPCSRLLGEEGDAYVRMRLGTTLVRICPTAPPSSRVVVEGRDVIAFGCRGEAVLLLQRQASGLHALVVREPNRVPVTVRTVECEGEAAFGFGGPLHLDPFGLLALRQDRTRWDVLYREPATHDAACESLRVPPDVEVVAPFGLKGRTPGLIGLHADGRTLVLCNRAGVAVLRCGQPLRAVTASLDRPEIAVLDDRGVEVRALDGWILVHAWEKR